eukprot:394428_1
MSLYCSLSRSAASRIRGSMIPLHRHLQLPKRLMSTNNNSSNWRKNGTPEITFGVLLLSALAIDQVLQTRQEDARKNMLSELEVAIQDDERKEKFGSGILASKEKLFDCIVRRLPKYFDGSKSLTDVEVGDKVSVVEEFVGGDKMYHLCRIEKNGNTMVGWFPISCLEKLQ